MHEFIYHFRVRYAECDPMGVAHHSAYPVWFEIGRTEMLRTAGLSYREMEQRHEFIVVIDLHIRYRMPARYDDELALHTSVAECSRVKLRHDYRLMRGDNLLASARITLACVDAAGRVRELPSALQMPADA